jgi:hypothetical protein
MQFEISTSDLFVKEKKNLSSALYCIVVLSM